MPRTYDEYREKQAEISRERAKAGRDIGSIPPVRNPQRKACCRKSYERFCRTYFPDLFELAWSDDHRRAIDRMQHCVLTGGQFALAMPRGSGKTTLLDVLVLWALLYGLRRFVVFVGAEATSATERLDAIKGQLEGNDLLLDDFPEVCYPIRRLEGIAHRCSGQLCNGERTLIEWTATSITLPTIKGSRSSGAVLRVAGITGRIRGMNVNKRRPDLVVMDDIQTRESANSFEQCETRLQIVNGDILGLAGPRKKIAAFNLCTVIRDNDVADQLLDRQRNPTWNGERCKLINRLPANLKLWDQYATVRAAGHREGRGNKDACEFYQLHRSEMDAGADVAWPHRFNPDQISGLQFAMDLYYDAPESFYAEYQNQPVRRGGDESALMKPAEIAAKLCGVPRGTVPLAALKLTAFIDVQGKALFWMVCAWGNGLTGWIVDYGVYPEQPASYVTLATLSRTLADKDIAPRKAGQLGQIRAGLERLTEALQSREWRREDGTVMRLAGRAIDANWGKSTDTVYEFCRSTVGEWMPSHGKYIGPIAKPLEQYKVKPGEQVGVGWMIGKAAKRLTRHLIIDTNHWKTAAHGGLSTPLGDAGSISICGRKGDEHLHKMLADNLVAESRSAVEGKGRKIDIWSQVPGADNHLLDCLVGCIVLAATLGLTATPKRMISMAPRPVRPGLRHVRRRVFELN